MMRAETVLIVLLLSCSSLYGAADLRLTGLKATFHSDSRTVDLLIEMENHGPARADRPGCNVNVFAGEKLLVSQTFSLGPLAAGESRKETLPVIVPGERVTRIQAEIYDSVEPDLQPSTNFLQIHVQPPGLKKVDLQISEATVEDPENPRYKTGILRVLLINGGPEKAPGSTLLVELEVFSDVVASSERRIRPLNAGETHELKMPLPQPALMTSSEGIAKITWTLADAKFYDTDPMNNSYRLRVPLQIRMPDLIAEKIEIKKSTISFTIRNQGNVRAGESISALYVNNALVMRFETPEIPPGRSRSFKFEKFSVSEDPIVAVVADFNAEVEEYSEENNKTQYPGEE